MPRRKQPGNEGEVRDENRIVGSDDPGTTNPAYINGVEVADFAAAEPTDYGTIAADSAEAPRVKRKYTKRGSKNGAGKPAGKKASVQASLKTEHISQMVFNIHMMLAAQTEIEELALTQDEAGNLTTAVLEVASHYDIIADPKIVAWVNLVFVGGAIYGTRAIAYSRRLKAESQKPEPQPPPPQSESGQVIKIDSPTFLRN